MLNIIIPLASATDGRDNKFITRRDKTFSAQNVTRHDEKTRRS